MKLLITLLGCALLTGCFHRPTVEEAMAEVARIQAQTPADVRALMESSMISQTRSIRPGQTLQDVFTLGPGMFTFKGEPGSQVTVTVRSETDSWLSLHHLIATVGTKAIAMDQRFGYSFDVNGPNSEVVVTLPPDDDKTYFILVFMALKKDGTTLPPGGTFSLSLASGAAPAQDILRLPQPLPGSGGQYMSPFTEDDTVAPWVEKGLAVSAGMSAGSAVGNLAAASQNGSAALIGAGATLAAREMALQAVGGWEFIKANSDLSFNTAADLARDLHFRHAGHPQYRDVLAAVYPIYPEIQGEIQLLERDQAAEAASAETWSKGQ